MRSRSNTIGTAIWLTNARHPRAGAEMRSGAERQVGLLLPEDIEFLRIAETTVVVVGGADAQTHLLALVDQRARDLDVAGQAARIHADRRDPAHRFFESLPPERGLGANARQLVGILQQPEDQRQDRVAGLVQPAADRDLDVGVDLLDRLRRIGLKHR